MQRKTLAHHKLHHFWHFPEALQKYFFFSLQKGGKKPSGRISAEKAEKMTVSQEKREGSRYVWTRIAAAQLEATACPKHIYPPARHLPPAAVPWSRFRLPGHCRVTLPSIFYCSYFLRAWACACNNIFQSFTLDTFWSWGFWCLGGGFKCFSCLSRAFPSLHSNEVGCGKGFTTPLELSSNLFYIVFRWENLF